MESDPGAEAALAPRWCVVANVIDERAFGKEERTVRGTKHFRPGGKVYVFGLYAGMCEAVVVVARHRGSNRYTRLVMRAAHLRDFRPKLAYSPRVLELMMYRADGCYIIEDEASARRWSEVLPWWGPPNYGRRPGS